MTDSPIRVVIVDDHAVVRSGLAAMLAAYERVELVGEATSGGEALDVCEQLRPDVVLMDLKMPGVPVAEAISRIGEVCPDTKVIALTSYSDEGLVRSVMQAGAVSYLMKNVSADTLVEAIRAATNGESVLSAEARHALLRHPPSPPAVGEDLSPRERDVLQLLVEGLHNREIGKRLTISPSTVKFHVSNLLNKLGTRSRTQAVAIALQLNLASRPGGDLPQWPGEKPTDRP